MAASQNKGRVTVAALSERVDAQDAKLDAILAHLTAQEPKAADSEPQEDAPKPKASRGKGRSTATPKESKWVKGCTFTYVKKGGGESQFEIVGEADKKGRVPARNRLSGFATTFKLTTLDALVQSKHVKDVS